MNSYFSRTNIAIVVLLLMLGQQFAFAKKMYRWVDEQGNVRYSDQVPPDQAKHRRESLNQNARVVDVLEKEKTKSQVELEKRLLMLRRQQEDIISKQKAQDKVLLSTFRNIDDMKMTIRGKMLALGGQRKVLESNLKGLEYQLQQQQQKAAQFERDGSSVPKNLLTKISDTKKQVSQTNAEITTHDNKQKKINEQLQADLTRFAYLTQTNIESKELSLKSAETIAANQLGLFICDSIDNCEKAWLYAKQFISQFSTTGIDIETEKLIMSKAPYKDTDLSLSVSIMDKVKNKKQIFLDIRCRQSSLGEELCASPKAEKIRFSFSGYIKSALEKEL